MKQEHKKIVVLGSANTDMMISGKEIPVPGEMISGGTFLMNPGGKGANQAVAVARLSARKGVCTFIAKAAAISVTRPGAQNSIPFRKEV